MVRLLPARKALEFGRHELGFNPTMVRLLLNPGDVVQVEKASFNPTMVRLLPPRRVSPLIVSPLFQSHNGAIAACL